jgi:hypothetical protein
VWAQVTTLEGGNYELGPRLRMTARRPLRGATLEDLPLGECAGRSWLLALGAVPVDYDDLTLVERGPDARFLERSPMLSMRSWEHERTVSERGERACELADRLAFDPRVPGTKRVVGAIFRHRHRRLRRRSSAMEARGKTLTAR